MAGTQVQSARNSILIDDVNQYEIISTCVVAGDLSDTSIFLLNILQEDDPKSDTLVRVIALADVDAFSTDRATAIANGENQWRAAQVRLVFDNITTGNAGQKELSSRINTLVEEFDLNNAEFEVVNEVVIYPVADPSVKAQLETEYATARDTANGQEETRDVKVSECQDLSTEVETLQERLVEAQQDFEATTGISGQLTLLNQQSTSAQGSGAILVFSQGPQISSSDATDAQKTQMSTTNTAIATQINIIGDVNSTWNGVIVGPLGTQIATLQARVNSLTAELTAKNIAFTTCNNDLSQLQGALDAARATEDAALAAVVAVCPDFDLNSV